MMYRPHPSPVGSPVLRLPPHRHRVRFSHFLLGAIGLLVSSTTVMGETGKGVEFNRDVRPVLAQYCFKCHGSDEHGRQGSLRLDRSESAIGAGDSGKRAIVPHQPEASEVIRRIRSQDPEVVMPPPHTKTTMPESAREIIRAWIESGAEYQEHWAYVPPKPSFGDQLEIAAKTQKLHPIDYFIQERLRQAGLKPSPEADRYTLIRRLYLDLIGLPPTSAEADRFIADTSPKAYEKLVDELLQSKHYGERWARRWLDLARYADTNGYEKDRPRTIWPYRDWVVRAINADMPYDQFSIKQLAGDMLPDAQPDDFIATGFHRNTMLNEEGGIDPLEYRFYAMVDRVGVTGTTWMGLTLNCAQCHTHKYDPIEHTDFYRIMALLNNADEPTYHIPPADSEARYRAHQESIDRMEKELPTKYPGGEKGLEENFSSWLQQERSKASDWQAIPPVEIKTNLPKLELQESGFLLGRGDISKSDVYELTFKGPLRGVRALRIEVESHPSLPNDGPGLTDYEGPIGGFFLSELQAFQQGNRIELVRGQATNEDEEDRVNDGAGNKPKVAPKKKPNDKKVAKKNTASAALDGEMSSGWQVLGGFGVRHAAVFHFDKPVDLEQGIQLKMLFEKHFACSLGHFRISWTTNEGATATGHPADIETLLVRPNESLTEVERERLKARFLETTPEMEDEVAPLLKARQNPLRGQSTLAMQERPKHHLRRTYRYHRGEFLQPKEEVNPGVPSFLPPLGDSKEANRLAFAKWLFSDENPLTARVAVNRQWQAFFGRGIVKSLEDFGYQSEPPTHPELLDWLAIDFVRNGWSMKKLHRNIVMSATYRQASRITPEMARVDPDNLLLARGARFRLDAEVIRDASLRAAGVLSEKMGGPGVYPPQPASVTTEGTYGKVDWKTSEGEDRFRRSLYTFVKRTAPFAMASTFDAPSGESCLARREVSNSPLQALTLLNDQMFMEASQAMAKQVMLESESDESRLENIFRRCLTRPMTAEEREMLLAFLKKERDRKLDGEPLWSVVCRALLNLDETITHP